MILTLMSNEVEALTSQLTFICSEPILETLEKGVKYVQG